jgi:NAD-dependent SIR2 family protein deacetylase
MTNACLSRLNTTSYTQREPRKNQYYRCVEDHFEELEGCWDKRFRENYGFWRPHVTKVIYEYLDCGDLHNGFARVKCEDCNKEYLLPFSCKKRHFCPSCHQKRVIAFGEQLVEEVLEDVPHRQWVFSLPKRLRVYFKYDRKLLSKLSKCACNVLSKYLITGVDDKDTKTVPGIVIAIQTFGDFLNFNPHLHIMATDGCFKEDGTFIRTASPKAEELTMAFQMEILKMLKKQGKISEFVVENMKSWKNSGFNVYCGLPIFPDEEESLERLAQYIVRAPISQERMLYIPEENTKGGTAKVVYTGKNSNSNKTETFDALEWLAKVVSHVPNKGEQLVRYYGYYSNKARGLRKKVDETEITIETSAIKRKAFSRNWARLIQKIYNIDPLKCEGCGGKMKIIEFVEDEALIKKILVHLKLWEVENKDPPKQKSAVPQLEYLDYETIAEYSEISDYREFEYFEY